MGQPDPHVAEFVEADADPEDADTQQADAESPADQKTLARPPPRQQAIEGR